MNSAHAKEEGLAAIALLRDWFGEPGTAAAKRPRGREPHSEGPDQRAVAIVGRREGHPGSDRQSGQGAKPLQISMVW
jgi:hypothetical protein